MYQRCLKRAFDVTAVLLLSPILLLLWAPIAFLIWYDDRGPILFRQMRPGLNGKPFCVLKFRSMAIVSADNKAADELRRITRIGRYLRKTSLDELPQLLNIFRGEMSLIGPRPLLCGYLPYYTPEEARRHL